MVKSLVPICIPGRSVFIFVTTGKHILVACVMNIGHEYC